MNEQLNRIKELEESLRAMLNYVYLDTDLRTTYAVMVHPVQALRNAANEYEKKEREVHKARLVLNKG